MTRPSSDDTSRPAPDSPRPSRVGTIVLLGFGALVAVAVFTSLLISISELAQP